MSNETERLAYLHRLHQMESDRNVKELIKLDITLRECLTCFASLPVEFIEDKQCKWCKKS